MIALDNKNISHNLSGPTFILTVSMDCIVVVHVVEGIQCFYLFLLQVYLCRFLRGNAHDISYMIVYLCLCSMQDMDKDIQVR